ncbi:MAG: TolC family protein [Victivallales bacterium]|nr:TolC family protein [Victivallales bacterium]
MNWHTSILRASAFLVLGVAGTVAAAEKPAALPAKLSLSEALRIAAAHNKSIQAAQLQAQADRHRITTAEGAFDPTVYGEAGWVEQDESAVRSAEGRLGAGATKRFATGTEIDVSTAWTYTDDHMAAPGSLDPLHDAAGAVVVTQDLLRDFGAKINGKAIRVATNDWRSSEEGVRDSLIWNLYQVEYAYWQLYYAEADLQVRQKQLARARRLVEVAQAQVRVGEAAPIEITRSRSSAASQEVSILNAKNDVARIRNRLLRLLGVIRGDTLAQPLELTDAPPAVNQTLTLEQSLAVAREQRPDCRQAELALANAGEEADFAKNQLLPSLRVYGGVGVSGDDDRFGSALGDFASVEGTTWEVGIRAEFPLGNRIAKGRHGTAKALQFRAVVRQRDVLELATREVADAFDTLTTSARKIDTARQSRELADELLTAEGKSFKLGRSTSLDVLDAQQSLAQAEREEVRARIAYAAALGNLYAVRGDYLVAKKIPVEAQE